MAVLRRLALSSIFGGAVVSGDSLDACGTEGCSAEEEEATLLQVNGRAQQEQKAQRTKVMGVGGGPSYLEISRAYKEFVATPPEELRDIPLATGSKIELNLGTVELPTPWIGGSFMTRGYGDIPGPTIRVKPGDTIEVKLNNNLGPGPGYEACGGDETQYGFFMNPDSICLLNQTNLHLHGLHISPEGDSDNIFVSVSPGQSRTYKFEILANHMGGTHWYHPHIHHATAAQAGGGAHGAFIVEDPPGYLPKFVEDMPEKVMVLSLVNVAKSMRLEAWGHATADKVVSKQTLWKNSKYPKWEWNLVTGLLIEEHGDALKDGLGISPYVAVNGQFRPKMTIKEGKWHRFRFIMAAIEQRVEIAESPDDPDQASCEFQLLAKDGIYLNDAPRSIEKIFLVSGSRADVAVRCTCGPSNRFPWHTKRPCKVNLDFTAKWQPMGTMNIAATLESTTDRMLTLVTESADEPASIEPDIEPFKVRRPCYLADLTKAKAKQENTHSVDLPMMYPMQVTVDGVGYIWGHHQPPALAEVPVGEIQEWHLTGIRYHPLHVHVNSYQITSIWNDPYYKVGDWQDTFFPTGVGFATIRFNADRFTGKMIAHCHLLEHEDNGMMGWFHLTGNEGDTWKDAKKYDPHCYEDAYPGPVKNLPETEWR